MTAAVALAWCEASTECGGCESDSFFGVRAVAVSLTPKGAPSVTTAGAACNSSGLLDIRFKDGTSRPNGDKSWSHWAKPSSGRIPWQERPQYEAWMALGEALNESGRPIYYSICPHTVSPDKGTAAEFAGLTACKSRCRGVAHAWVASGKLARVDRCAAAGVDRGGAPRACQLDLGRIRQQL